MTQPKYYRKKPVVVQAMQYSGSNAKAVQQFVGGAGFALVHSEDPEITAVVWDKLHSTWVGVKDGQWIIKGVQGEFYPCDDEVFKETYEPC